MELKEIAVIHTDFPEKFGIPRQSGLVGGLQGTIVFSPEYRNADAIRGLNDFSHLWLVWGFSKAKKDHWSATVRPPRLGGKVRMGIFATRSPFRPNPIGLSSVKLESVTMDEKLGPIITVSGIDMLDGTPIYDIKPYLPHIDSHPEATGGFALSVSSEQLEVIFPDHLLQKIPEADRKLLSELLSQDPRDRFIHDNSRIWGLTYGNYNIVSNLLSLPHPLSGTRQRAHRIRGYRIINTYPQILSPSSVFQNKSPGSAGSCFP